MKLWSSSSLVQYTAYHHCCFYLLCVCFVLRIRDEGLLLPWPKKFSETTEHQWVQAQRRTSHKYFRTSTTPFFFFFFFFSDAIVLATNQVVFADFVFNQFLSDFKNKHTAAKVL